MHTGNFNLESFAAGTILLVIVPTVASVFLLSKAKSDKLSPPRTLFKGSALAFLVGLFSAVIWLSWSPTSGLSDFLRYGAPRDFPQSQIIGCGVTVTIGSAIIATFFSRYFKDVLALSIFTAAGFSVAFSIGVSFGTLSQEGVGIFFSFVGISTLCAIVNSIIFFLRQLLSRRTDLLREDH